VFKLSIGRTYIVILVNGIVIGMFAINYPSTMIHFSILDFSLLPAGCFRFRFYLFTVFIPLFFALLLFPPSFFFKSISNSVRESNRIESSPSPSPWSHFFILYNRMKNVRRTRFPSLTTHTISGSAGSSAQLSRDFLLRFTSLHFNPSYVCVCFTHRK
jgi:hypothetical protein